MTNTMKAFFRMIAASFKTESAATALAGVAVVIVSLFTGYTIPEANIPGALRWIMYINVSSYPVIVCSCAYAYITARAIWLRGSSNE